jgi:hypothetical protein
MLPGVPLASPCNVAQDAENKVKEKFFFSPCERDCVMDHIGPASQTIISTATLKDSRGVLIRIRGGTLRGVTIRGVHIAAFPTRSVCYQGYLGQLLAK